MNPGPPLMAIPVPLPTGSVDRHVAQPVPAEAGVAILLSLRADHGPEAAVAQQLRVVEPQLRAPDAARGMSVVAAALLAGAAAVVEDLVRLAKRPVAFRGEGFEVGARQAVDVERVHVVGSGVGFGALGGWVWG